MLLQLTQLNKYNEVCKYSDYIHLYTIPWTVFQTHLARTKNLLRVVTCTVPIIVETMIISLDISDCSINFNGFGASLDKSFQTPCGSRDCYCPKGVSFGQRPPPLGCWNLWFQMLGSWCAMWRTILWWFCIDSASYHMASAPSLFHSTRLKLSNFELHFQSFFSVKVETEAIYVAAKPHESFWIPKLAAKNLSKQN